MSPQDFEAVATGKTIYFSDNDQNLSAEQYLSNRRVILLHDGGTCMHGHWQPEGDKMCFYYEQDPDRAHCWHYIAGPGDLRKHRFVDETGPTDYELTIQGESTEPLKCPAPALGVSYTPVPQQ